MIHNFYVQDHCVINLIHLEKQSRPGKVRGHVRVQKFHEDPSLCPVAAVMCYNNKVKQLVVNFII